MKNLFTAIFTGLCGLFLTACDGEKVFGGSWVAERFAGIPDELFYQTNGSCDDGSLTFRVLVGGGAILWDVPQTQSESDILTGQFYIYLNRDGTYTANYREYTFHTLDFEEQFAARYSFDRETRVINFPELGTATIHVYKDRYYLRLILTTNINSAFLRGQTMDIWLRSAANGLNTDRDEYCSLRS